MADYKKQSPNYWCKHCAVFVRDTKLERQNHESTARHQGSIKRALRDLYRTHERDERDKERAKREISRLTGVVGRDEPRASGSAVAAKSTSQPSESQLKRQREQLAGLGVAVPSDFRAEMAMPGEWTVTNTRVVEPADQKAEKSATGVRKREVTEEEKDEEDAVKGLFKKAKRWGRDKEDEGLDELLSGGVKLKSEVKDESEAEVKGEDGVKEVDEAKKEVEMKTEDDAEVKTEEAALQEAPVVFKKRKPKALRTK